MSGSCSAKNKTCEFVSSTPESEQLLFKKQLRSLKLGILGIYASSIRA